MPHTHGGGHIPVERTSFACVVFEIVYIYKTYLKITSFAFYRRRKSYRVETTKTLND